MKRLLPIGLFLSLSFLYTMTPLSASHLSGLELTYECMGSDIYRVYFRGYYDCSAAYMTAGGHVPIDSSGLTPPAPAPGLFDFAILSTPGCPSPIPLGTWSIESYMDITLVCPTIQSNCENLNGPIDGIAEATYFLDYDFSGMSCTTYTAYYSNCCRSNSINSINNPGSSWLFLEAFEMRVDSALCNSSPVIIEDPAVYVCSNTLTSISQEAIDIDGDSLVYLLDTCFDDITIPVSYFPGYSPSSPLGPNWNVQINPTTGWLTFAPMGVGSLEVGVMAIRVDEYRNGFWIGQITRDIQVTVLSCGNSQVPVAGGLQVLSGGNLIGADTVQACPGTPLVFSVSVQDADTGDVVTITSDLSQSLPGAVATASGVNPTTIQVSWTPPASLYGQVVPWLLSANDDACPISSEIFQNYYVSLTGTCLSGIVTNSACNDSTGAIDLQVFGGTPPYSFLWSTGDTTEDLSNLSPGVYWVGGTDANGFLGSDTLYVNSLELLIGSSLLAPACDVADGSISLNVSGGTPPYAFLWTNGGNSSQINGLAAGGYAVDITDFTGCFSHAAFVLAPADSCEVTIEGTVYYDANANCVQDPGELGLPFYYLDLAPGGAVLTGLDGSYSLSVEPGAHTLTGVPNPFTYSAISCPADSQHEFLFTSYDDDTSGVDFAVELIPVQDLFVSLSYGPPPVPGMPWSLTILAANLGNVPASPATLNLQHDPAINFVSSSPAGTYTAGTQSLEWQFTPLASGQFEWLTVQFMVDSASMLGDTLSFWADVLPVIGDTIPTSNFDSLQAVVVAAYDPNVKRVNPVGIGPSGLIQNKQRKLDYTVYFQNTGNWPATYVIIRDTIDANLDLSTFRGLGQSHSYIAEVEEDSILVFRFDNISLPDSATDPTGSIGHISYQLSHAGNLPLGTQITNSAAIYFDFNPPIFTNEVVNTIFRPMSIGLSQLSTATVSLQPNPFSTTSLLSFPNPGQQAYRLQLTDLRGRLVQEYPLSRGTSFEIIRKELKTGLYLYHLIGDTEHFVGKVLIH